MRPLLDAAWRCTRACARFMRRLIPRLYGLGLLLLICWLTFLSIRYLVRSLVTPLAAPQQIVGIPTRMKSSVLATERSAWKAIAAVETPRIPAAHYHRIDSWIEPDRFNDCARSGCHSPLPHSRRKEVRAFLNMHATSIHCGVCHMAAQTEPLRMTWYDLETGKAQSPPAILNLYGLLTSGEHAEELKSPDEALQERIVRLLRLAAHDAGDSKALANLARHFAAVRASSPAFQRLVDEARTALPRHFRGEYGAKLALRSDAGRPILGHPGGESAARTFLEMGDRLSGEEKTELLERIHTRGRETPLKCTNCHTATDSEIPFSRLGYSAARVQGLVDPVVFKMIEHIDAGRPFNLPRILTPGDED